MLAPVTGGAAFLAATWLSGSRLSYLVLGAYCYLMIDAAVAARNDPTSP